MRGTLRSGVDLRVATAQVNYAHFCNRRVPAMKSLVSYCPIEAAMAVLGGRWPALLIYFLKDGAKRFNELRRDNPTVSHRMLSLELRKLEASGIVRRTEHPGYPRRVDYEMTPAGQRLLPLMDAIGDWWEATHDERAQARVLEAAA